MMCASMASGSAAKLSAESPVHDVDSTITQARTPHPTAAGSTSAIVRRMTHAAAVGVRRQSAAVLRSAALS
jgi:hypothetical protein